jgi:bacillolysin
VNGGAWQLVSAGNFVYNAYNTTLNTAGQGNSNPIAGQPAFTGTDAGSVGGSWGRSIVNLSAYAAPGDKIKLRFEMGQDGCGGVSGWYLDDVTVYRCPTPVPN